MQEITAPRSTDEIRSALRRQAEGVVDYLESLPTEEFFEPQQTYWAPSEHLRHLVKCLRPLVRALRLPKAVLLLRFGPSFRGSRAFEEVRDQYRAELAAGATAGRFTPSSREVAEAPEQRREQIFEHWRSVMEALDGALGRWGEGPLDRLRLPHPLLGKMTVREMLVWTVYHNHHHLERVRERRRGHGPNPPG